MERGAQQAQRQRLAYAKAVARQEMLEDADEAARFYAHRIDRLTNAHRVALQRHDWTVVASAIPPTPPERTAYREQAAERERALYMPGWFAETFGFAKRRRAALSAAVTKARGVDEESYQKDLVEFNRRAEEIAFAQRIIDLDQEAILAALGEHADFSSVAIEGLSALFTGERIIAVVDGLEVEDLPTESVTLLQSGKASFKALTTTRIMELHRDNLCSSAMRAAVEFLKVIPVEAVEVVVNTDLLDAGTGHISAQPVFYARVTAQALSSLNLPLTEPVALAERLGAHFNWNKREGFRAIDLASFNVPMHAETMDVDEAV